MRGIKINYKTMRGLHNLNASPNIIRIILSRRMKEEGHIARIGEMRNIYKMLVGQSKLMRPLGAPRNRWKDNTRMWTGFICLRTETSKHTNEPRVS
jgi:hypothetical protein